MQRVLLVEDDPSMLSLLTTLLSIEGFEAVHHAVDSEEGILDFICQSKPDLVFMDVNLRRANGLNVLRRLRSESSCPHTRVIISSGIDYGYECRQLGADCFLQKPYLPDDLLVQIRSLLALDQEHQA